MAAAERGWVTGADLGSGQGGPTNQWVQGHGPSMGNQNQLLYIYLDHRIVHQEGCSVIFSSYAWLKTSFVRPLVFRFAAPIPSSNFKRGINVRFHQISNLTFFRQHHLGVLGIVAQAEVEKAGDLCTLVLVPLNVETFLAVCETYLHETLVNSYLA